MSRSPYDVTLWYRRARILFSGLVTEGRAVVASERRWLDLSDEASMTEEVAALAERHCGDEKRIGQYALQVNDPVTGEFILRFAPTLGDLKDVRAGVNATPAGAQSLQEVSDEALVRELARRLRER